LLPWQRIEGCEPDPGGSPSGSKSRELRSPVRPLSERGRRVQLEVPVVNEEAQSVPDEELVARTLRGDASAFERIVERYQQSVFNIAYYKSRNCFDAEDLAQDVFLAAFRALGTLQDRSNFASWLFGIAYNRCHKWYHRERNKIVKIEELRRQVEQEARLAGRAARRGPNVDEPETSIDQILDHLSPEAREVLRLKYLEGLSYEAIEARLGIKAHRIDYLIRRSKKEIRERRSADSRDSDVI
jgi:RNA polymerase sigma-70 factor (ECF subfamily)